MQSIHPEAIDYLISVDKFSDFNNAQKDILNKEFLDYSSNYIIATNTGTGKTALAQLRIVDTLKNNKKVIFISPYKAIAEEKRQDFEFYKRYGWSCISSANPNDSKDNFDYSKYNIISMTYEKFDSVLNNARFIKGWLNDVGLIVVDEAHMISDTERGPTLESSIAKVITLFAKKIRILMLSAVLPNVGNIANWIDAKYGTSVWRPVDLEIGFVLYKNNSKLDNVRKNKMNTEIFIDQLKPREILVKYGSLNKINKIIYIGNLKSQRIEENNYQTKDNLKSYYEKQKQITASDEISNSSISISNSKPLEKNLGKDFEITTSQDSASLNAIYKALEHEQKVKDIDNPLWFLSEQTIKENGQVLIFSTDRASTESIAIELANQMSNSKNFHNYLSLSDLVEIDKFFLSKMKVKDDKLIKTMKNGVAFHHAGLDLEKRKLVEDAYKSGKIKILLSTTTLIAGVNLPATLVVFESLSFWDGNRKQIMTKRDFLNGCGRAGRPGLETRGRALIMASSIVSAIRFIARPLEKVESQFSLDSLVFQTLSIIKRNSDLGQRFTTINDIKDFFKNTLYSSSGFKIDVQSYLDQLIHMKMISIYNSSQINYIDFDMNNIRQQYCNVIDKTSEINEKNNTDRDNNHHCNRDLNNSKYLITKLGYETIRFYLNPRTGFLIRNMLLALESHLLKTNFNSSDSFQKITYPFRISLFSIIHTLVHAKELQNLWKTTKLKDKETEFIKDHNQEIMFNRSMYIQSKLSEDERKCLCTSMAFYDKLNMYDISHRSFFESLYQRFGRGDFTALQENMEWLVEASLRISKVILTNFKIQNVISNMLSILAKRISSGMIKEELLELCSIREIGRVRSVLLENAGINSIDQLLNPTNRHTISSILGSEHLSARVIENAKKIFREKK